MCVGLILIGTVVAIWGVYLTPLIDRFVSLFKASPINISVATIVAAYVLAFAVEGLHDQSKALMDSAIKKLRKGNNAKKKLYGDENNEKTTHAHDGPWRTSWREFYNAFPRDGMKRPARPSVALAIDVLRVLDPAVGARIVKLRAEMALCRKLAVGWALMAAILVVQNILIYMEMAHKLFTLTVEFYSMCAVGAGAFLVWRRERELNIRHLRALFNHWLVLVNPKAPGLPELDSPFGAELGGDKES